MGQNYQLPEGTQPIRAQDPWRPGQTRLVGARDRRCVHFFRSQDKRHYPVPKEELFDPDEVEILRVIEAQAQREGLLPVDVAKRLLVTAHAHQLDAEAREVLALLRPFALRHKLDLVQLCATFAQLGDLILEIQACALLEGVGAGELFREFTAWRARGEAPAEALS